MSGTLKNYLSLIKFSHTIFALPFAVIGFSLGASKPGYFFDWHILLQVILCMVFARTAAMTFNRWADRKIDEKNDRTKIREIPQGIISPKSAITLVFLSSMAFIATTWFINPICFYLSPVALLIVLGYSYTKRFTWLCHLVLGLGLSMAPIGAYLAVTGQFDWIPLFFSFTVITWVSGFDIIYALQDEEFDKTEMLYSMPSAFGKKNALYISSVLHFLAVCFLVLAGWQSGFGIIYWTGLIVFASLIVYQHTLVKPGDLKKVNIAFATTNGIASLVFATFVVFELLIK